MHLPTAWMQNKCDVAWIFDPGIYKYLWFFMLVMQEAVQVSRDENQNYKEYTISSPASLSPGPYSPESPSSPDRKGGRITPTNKRYIITLIINQIQYFYRIGRILREVLNICLCQSYSSYQVFIKRNLQRVDPEATGHSSEFHCRLNVHLSVPWRPCVYTHTRELLFTWSPQLLHCKALTS